MPPAAPISYRRGRRRFRPAPRRELDLEVDDGVGLGVDAREEQCA